ncbi:MAG: T9SS type A sorting domain-containing protein [Candidatus Eisenbacteria bacterium]|uniref:T9SS type A sorting domain-containing protein n=1 Tax=Eiseniibacteriota bacterium TaxID=2212470 RepID=A0A933WA46_UNCEI|nr:T9SS type A sorting domain-containing protein [Candidatus Eisenbacteria bacterium]
MHLDTIRRRLSALTLLALAAVAGFLAAPSPASAQDEAPVYATDHRAAITEYKRQQLLEEFRHEQRERREQAERARKAAKKGRKGAQVRRVEETLGLEDIAPAAARRVVTPFGAVNLAAVPLNTKANDKTADAAGAGQAEQHIVFRGLNGLCAWNDGQGFNLTPQDVQGYAYTTNGGATWTDGGIPPKTAAITTWTSDPVVTVNEKTGDFYYCGLTSNPSSTNGLAVVRGTFSGAAFNWSTPVMVASGANASAAYDKQWFCADSSTGNLYVTYTKFVVGGNAIWFQRSTDNGATWSTPLQISSATDNGYVQGSRPAVGPNGEVYVVYYAIGLINDYDYMKIRKSTDGGVTFGAETIAASLFTNFGTGAPGFNRERGITMPGIAVDRSFGPNRGRVFVSYNETVDWLVDPLGGGGSKSEVENNGNFANATAFTIGQTIRGSMSSTTDTDNWKFSAVQGSTYIFWVDSLRSTYKYTFRVYCPNDTSVVSRIAMGGNASTAGQQGFIVWTAPSTATYYLRWSPATGTGTGTGYRIRTGVHTANVLDVARDQRDAIVVSSPNGVAWSAGVRMNDDAARYDNWLPEVAVASDGAVYGFWTDFRDAAASCGGGSHMRLSRSFDGGATWAANQIVTSSLTANWTQVSSNIAPNQGDYNGFYGGDLLSMAWADGRLGDADVYTARVPVTFTLGSCVASQTIVAGNTLSSSVDVNNLNSMFGNTYNYSISVNRSWPGFPVTGTIAVGESGTNSVPVSITVPDSAAHNEVVTACVTVSINGAAKQSCCFNLQVNNIITPALASLASSTAEPGRVSLRWLVDSRATVNAYRSTDGVQWEPMGQYSPDAEGYVTVEDLNVRGGERLAYRLGLVSGGREVFAGTSWIAVPAGAEFAIDRVFPSPAKAGFSVSFSLPNNRPATLDLIDLAGRRVLSRNVGVMGAGRHTLSLEGETSRLPIGVYGIRLSQDGRVATSKVSIVR